MTIPSMLTVKEQSGNVMAEFPEGSFARLFWQQQCEAATRKGIKCGM